MSSEFDLVVIGAGSAGIRASRVAAALGARVAVCERGPLGGTCVNVGCVPKKLLSYGAHFSEEVEDARGYGWSVEPPTHDWATLIARQDRELTRLHGIYQRLLDSRGVQVLRGDARLVDPRTVVLTTPEGAEHTLRTRYVLLATGGVPRRPTFPGGEHTLVSDDVFRLRERPRRLVVLGGGYIAVEMASIFRGYGSDVTIVHRGPELLRGFDHDVRRHLAEELRKKGLTLVLGHEVTRVERAAHGALVVHAGAQRLEADAVLAAHGREPRLVGLGLEAVGVETTPAGIVVDASLRTSVPGVYAAGDVIARVTLTPVALAEGQLVARQLFAGESAAMAYADVPSAVFTAPPVATVGLTEEEARHESVTIDVYRTTFTPLRHTLTGRAERTLMKLVVERTTDRVLGVHVVGADAGEIVQGFAVAVRLGATKRALDSTLGIHPTAAEELVTMREVAPPEPGLVTQPRRAIQARVWPA